MSAPTSLAQRFLTSSGAKAPREGLDALERHLREGLEAARAAWPELHLDEGAFLDHLARQSGVDGGDEPLARLKVDDLRVAYACAQGDPLAMAAFDQKFMPEVAVAVARIDPSAAFAQEVQQHLREHLLMADGLRPPRIADYSGRGPLRSWLRAAAVRTALNLRRGVHPEQPGDEELTELPSSATNAELALLKARHAADFKACFDEALAALTEKERTILKLHLIDDLGIDQIGALYRVHRSTASRWITRTRDGLLEDTSRRLKKRLRLKSTELRSLLQVVRSQLDLSIRTALEK